jgi:hypothetical protein
LTSRLIFLIIEVIYSVSLLLSGGTGVNIVTNTEPLTVQQYEINITDEKTIVDKQAKQEFYENIILHSDEPVIKRYGNAIFAISENKNGYKQSHRRFDIGSIGENVWFISFWQTALRRLRRFVLSTS